MKYSSQQFSADADFYLQRFNAHDQLIDTPPAADTGIIVILPCVNEPDVLTPLNSLFACDRPDCTVEIIVLVNASEKATDEVIAQNDKTVRDVELWATQHNSSRFSCYARKVYGLKAKHAGAGWARKLAMDEATRRFRETGNYNGVIACFDADSHCDTNYLTSLTELFSDESVSGCSIYFEHDLSAASTPEHRNGILAYELHLRYLTQAMRWTGAPYAYHTVGSAMAVRVFDYIKIGGMNRRTAGEDFYFLHKIIPRRRFVNYYQTTVYPSARMSDRVPFGTGAAMSEVLEQKKKGYRSYSFEAFRPVKLLFESVDNLYIDNTVAVLSSLPFVLAEFLADNQFVPALELMRKNSASLKSFRIKFFDWFNAFRFIKYLNWAHLECLHKQDVQLPSSELLNEMSIPCENSLELILSQYRSLDKNPF